MTFKGPFQLKHVYDSMIRYILQYSKVVLCDQRLHWPKGCPSHPEIGRLMHGEVAPLQAEQAKQRVQHCRLTDTRGSPCIGRASLSEDLFFLCSTWKKQMDQDVHLAWKIPFQTF